MAVIVVGREMLVTTLRSFIEQSGGDFSAQMAGKLKMVFQCVAAVASLILLMQARPAAAWMEWTLSISVWVAVISTVYSGIGYVFVAAKYLR
jgi:CDP-diacylglycerol--glycerol-3-phosphate 3-phosphatidyltransferase